MKLSKEQAQIIWAAITTKGPNKPSVGEDGKPAWMPDPRTFGLTQITDAGKIIKEIKTKCVGEDENSFKASDVEVEFDLDQRKLIKDCLGREWSAHDGEVIAEVLALIEVK